MQVQTLALPGAPGSPSSASRSATPKFPLPTSNRTGSSTTCASFTTPSKASRVSRASSPKILIICFFLFLSDRVNQQLTTPVAPPCRGSYGRAGECGSWPQRWSDLGDATGFLATSAREFASANRITLIRWDHGPTSPNRTVTWSNGSIMRRAFAMAVATISLAGCSSFSTSSWNYFKSDPPTIQVQLESTPPGADARVSIGGGCKTPCSVSVTPPEGSTSFLVNYSMAGRQPAGVPVQIVKEG